MSDRSFDLPDAVTADLSESSVALEVPSDVYPLQAVYAASYTFIDRCYVLIEHAEPAAFRVTLTTREAGQGEEVLRALAGEFANQLLSSAWQHQIAQDNRVSIEYVTLQAMAGALGKPSLDDLESFDFTDEALDDPLGIAMSWEEKYLKKKPGEADGPSRADGGPQAGGQEPA